jgi:hypothetical protein
MDNAFIWKLLIAIFMGFGITWFSNSNRFHDFLPDSLTKRTSYPSEWFSAFNQNPRFVYLTFADGRRIFGWPKEWPDAPGSGHFVLENAEWILPDNTRVALISIEKILIPASDINLVEFEKEWDKVQQLSEEIQASSKIMITYNQTDNECIPKNRDKQQMLNDPAGDGRRVYRQSVTSQFDVNNPPPQDNDWIVDLE